ncbi:hypothetical protein QCW_0253 [Clostridioides difficile CD69]|nr:hypothetical protein QCW_0253 [Clostridioides difficile CD69]
MLSRTTAYLRLQSSYVIILKKVREHFIYGYFKHYYNYNKCIKFINIYTSFIHYHIRAYERKEKVHF